jgi:hypothetical protein
MALAGERGERGVVAISSREASRRAAASAQNSSTDLGGDLGAGSGENVADDMSLLAGFAWGGEGARMLDGYEMEKVIDGSCRSECFLSAAGPFFGNEANKRARYHQLVCVILRKISEKIIHGNRRQLVAVDLIAYI